MRRRRTFLIIFAVLVVILIGGVTALVLMSRMRPGPEPSPEGEEALVPPTATPAPKEQVVVIVQPVRRGERIPPDAVEYRDWEVDRLPDDYVTALEDVVGGYATIDLTPPQPLSASKVKTVVLEGSDISLAIPPGKVGYSFPVRLVSAVANAITPGDRVDVLISWTIVEVDQDLQIRLPVALIGGEDCLSGCQPTGEQHPGLVSQYTVQNALVLGVGLFGEDSTGVEVTVAGQPEEEPIVPLTDEGAEGEVAPEEAPPPAANIPPLSQITVVTLAVDPQYALVLKWAVESSSSLDLVLRSAADIEEFSQPEAVTLEYMINRYQISLPPRLPHALENEFKYPLIEKAEELEAGAATQE
jgi:Flp pilus assembly protein CpaB